ncbi:MAG: RDD family protein [Planctomycetota bacterium]
MQLRSGDVLVTALRLALACALGVGAACGTATAAPSASAWSADLPAVSDGRHLWTWAQDVDDKNPDQPQLSLYHADLTHRPPEGPAWELLPRLTGRLAARGVAADDDTLYLVFDDGSTHVVSLRPGPVEGRWLFSKRNAPSLPSGVSVRAAAAGHGELWTLVRIESAEALRQIDATVYGETASDRAVSDDEDKELFDLIFGYPDGVDTTSGPGSVETEEAGESAADDAEPADPSVVEESPETPDAAPTDTGVAPAEPNAAETPAIAAADPDPELTADLPTERLLVLSRNAWKNVPLPDDWPQKLPAQLVAAGREGGRPTLVAQVPTPKGETRARVFRPANDGWTSVELQMSEARAPGEDAASASAGGGIMALRANEQLVLVQSVPHKKTGFAAQVAAVRGDRLLPVADALLPGTAEAPDTGQWAAVPAEAGVALLAGQRALGERLNAQVAQADESASTIGPALTILDLHGQVALPPVVMHFEPSDPIAESADMVIFLGVLITSTVLLFTFWRRDPTANQLQLPADLALADTWRRALAGLIDLAPGLLVGTVAFGLAWDELYARWPGRGQRMTFELMMPGFAAIAVIVAHTALLEIATGGRSLGKLATGLRVATLDGRTPRAWQSLVRCLLKAFDLVAYLLLILPLISPHRQRLGDMVARTVVTMKAPPSDSDPAAKDDA